MSQKEKKCLKNKEDIHGTYFEVYDPSLTTKGGSGGKTEQLFRFSTRLSDIRAKKKKKCLKKKADIHGTHFEVYDPSLTTEGGSGGKTDQFFRFSTYVFLIVPNTFNNHKSNNIRDIGQKRKPLYFMTQVEP